MKPEVDLTTDFPTDFPTDLRIEVEAEEDTEPQHLPEVGIDLLILEDIMMIKRKTVKETNLRIKLKRLKRC